MNTINITRQEQALINAASTDKTRPNLSGVFYNCKHAVGCDGHKLAVMRKPTGQALANCIVRFSKKTMKKGWLGMDFSRVGEKLVSTTDTANSADIIEDAQFPAYDRVLNDLRDQLSESTVFEVTLNADSLKSLAAAIDIPAGLETAVTLTFHSANAPILVTNASTSTVGVLMPMDNSKRTVSALDQLKAILA